MIISRPAAPAAVARACIKLTTSIGLSLAVAGCNWTGSLGGPDRVMVVADEMNIIREYASNYAATADTTKESRNSFIAARMYAIDLQYTQYENAILREGQLVDFGTKLTANVLTTLGGLVTPLKSAHALSETATLINNLDSAYNDKMLKSQIIQNVLASMRAARNEQAAVIYTNMYCPVSLYPLGFALSDLEAYYRAGTFQTGLIKLMQTVSKAEIDAKAEQDKSKPVASVEAQAKSKANEAEAQVKATDSAARTAAAAGCDAPPDTRITSRPVRSKSAIAKRANPPPSPTAIAGQSSPKPSL